MSTKIFLMALVFSGLTLAQKNGGGGGGVTATGAAEVRIPDETIPAGATVQVKIKLTQPRPITTGGPRMPKSGKVLGVSVNSTLGDAAGVALDADGQLAFSVISPNSDFGANFDYPFITVAMALSATDTPGKTYPLTFSDTVAQTPTGPVTLSVTKPGTLTVGGALSLNGAIPGGGTWPAGTLIRLLGTGFQAGTKIVTKTKISVPVVVSPNEIRFVLGAATVMDQLPITATNPDRSTVTYYSYLRGVPTSVPARVMLRSVEPIYQLQTHSTGTFVAPATNAGQFSALSFQNPTADSAAITVQNLRSGVSSVLILPSLGRVTDDLQTMLRGTAVSAGDTIAISSTVPIQILGICGDEAAGTVKPFLPTF